jgi:hypothetical protein
VVRRSEDADPGSATHPGVRWSRDATPQNSVGTASVLTILGRAEWLVFTAYLGSPGMFGDDVPLAEGYLRKALSPDRHFTRAGVELARLSHRGGAVRRGRRAAQARHRRAPTELYRGLGHAIPAYR